MDNAATGFAVGTFAGAIVGGAWGGIHYSLQAAGKMSIRVSGKNYNVVKSHVNSFGFDNANNAMLNRIDGARKIKGADGRFFLHELKEAQLMTSGMKYDAAHEAALMYYHHNRFSLYAKDVVQMFASEFNKQYLIYWGLI